MTPFFSDYLHGLAAVMAAGKAVLLPFALHWTAYLIVFMVMILGASALFGGPWGSWETLQAAARALVVIAALYWYGPFTALPANAGRFLGAQFLHASEVTTVNAFDVITVTQERVESSKPILPSLVEFGRYMLVQVSLSVLEAVVGLGAGIGYICTALCALVGPALIPLLLFERTESVAVDWLRALCGASFMQVTSGAYMLIASSLLNAIFGTAATPISLSMSWSLLAPILIMIVVLGCGALMIPYLSFLIFRGGPSSAASPRSFRL